MAHTCNSSTEEVESQKDCEFEGNLGYTLRHLSNIIIINVPCHKLFYVLLFKKVNSKFHFLSESLLTNTYNRSDSVQFQRLEAAWLVLSFLF